MGSKRHFAFGGRHTSDKQRRDDYLLRRDTKSKYGCLVEDKPMPLIDIGVNRINEIIKEITVDNEDAFQETWVKILSDHCKDESDIKEYARQSLKEAIPFLHKYSEISLQKPLNNDNLNEKYVIGDTLSSPDEKDDQQIDKEIDGNELFVATATGKINRRGHVLLDYDVYRAIKDRYPHDPLNHAIRKLANLPPPDRDKLGWHKWEDAIIRARYPWGGTRACTLDLNRTQMSIIERAKTLKVKAGKSLNSYKPVKEWLNIPELADKLGITWMKANGLIKRGEIDSIRIPKYHQGHDGVFITPEALESYKKGEIPRTILQKQEIIRLKRQIAYSNSTKKREALSKAKAKYRERLYELIDEENELKRRMKICNNCTAYYQSK